jgi:hypothetical protein
MILTHSLIALAGVVAATGGGFFFVQTQSSRDQRLHHFQCPSCRRRLRYRSRQVGHRGRCGTCGSLLTFPPLSRAID